MSKAEQEAVRLLREGKLFATQISEETGVAVHRVRNLRRQYRIGPSDDELSRIRLANEAHAAKVAAAVEMLRNGARVCDVARKTGLTASQLSEPRRRAGLRDSYPMVNGYIYALACPRGKHVCYVGCSENPWVRYSQHLSSPVSSLMAEWIESLSEAGHSPRLILLANVSTDNWRKVEREWIAKVAALGHPLMNQEISGDTLWELNPSTYQLPLPPSELESIPGTSAS